MRGRKSRSISIKASVCEALTSTSFETENAAQLEAEIDYLDPVNVRVKGLLADKLEEMDVAIETDLQNEVDLSASYLRVPPTRAHLPPIQSANSKLEIYSSYYFSHSVSHCSIPVSERFFFSGALPTFT